MQFKPYLACLLVASGLAWPSPVRAEGGVYAAPRFSIAHPTSASCLGAGAKLPCLTPLGRAVSSEGLAPPRVVGLENLARGGRDAGAGPPASGGFFYAVSDALTAEFKYRHSLLFPFAPG